MNFADGEDPDDRVAAGGIPRQAEERLRALGAADGFFASALSVNEFALLSELGPRPLAQVLGASVMRVGPQFLAPLPAYVKPYVQAWESPYEEPSAQQRSSYQWNETVVCQLDEVTAAWDSARRLALGRLAEEARHVEADAVVGVHLQRGEHDWSKRTIDYLVSGTAIRASRSSGRSSPVMTDLSVQEYWRLADAGYSGVGLLMATAVVFASPSRHTRWQRWKTMRVNQELPELTRAFAMARDLVRYRLESQAKDARADGMVGVTFSHTVHREEFTAERTLQWRQAGWQRGALGIPYYVSRAGEAERRGWVITMHGVATAISRVHEQPAFPPETTVRMGS